jgi:hypothetical protein
MEMLRFFIAELAQVAVALQNNCTPGSCPMMCAGSTEFLCASHNPPKEVRRKPPLLSLLSQLHRSCQPLWR